MLSFVEIKRRIYGVVCDSDSDCKRKVIKRWKDERKKVKVPSGSPNCEYRIASYRIASSKEIQTYYRHLVESGGTRINRRCALQDIFLFLCNANNSDSPLFSFIDFILMGFLQHVSFPLFVSWMILRQHQFVNDFFPRIYWHPGGHRDIEVSCIELAGSLPSLAWPG